MVHSTAFRRLMYKTQVFINHEGDLFRTRLTHSLEVAQLSRSVARMLRLNEDLVEAIALAHDLGHTPFGHAGQDALHACMAGHGGFEHNLQSLRVVDRLEQRYPAFDGLNLSFETREGILKHCSRRQRPGAGSRRARRRGPRFIDGTQPSLEAQVSTWPTRSPTTRTTSTTACAPACSTPASWRTGGVWPHPARGAGRLPRPGHTRAPAAVRGAAPHVVAPGARTGRLHQRRPCATHPPMPTPCAACRPGRLACRAAGPSSPSSSASCSPRCTGTRRWCRPPRKARRVVADLFAAYLGVPAARCRPTSRPPTGHARWPTTSPA
jgi:hypothetical protein